MKTTKENQILIFKSDTGPEVDVTLIDENIWLTQAQMAELFERTRENITLHIKNIFNEEELDEKVVCKESLHTTQHGALKKKTQTSTVKLYNLDVIISVGYRVKSKRGTQFRIWANRVLKDYLIQGYAVNENKLKGQTQKIKQLEATIQSIVSASDQKELTNTEAKGVLRVIQDYTLALDLLDQYDHQKLQIENTNKQTGTVISYEEAMNAIATLEQKFRTDGESVGFFGKEKDDSFRSSIATIYQTFDQKELYPSIEEKAAHLLYFVIKNHSFVDGNKRIAAFVFVWFLERNDYLYAPDGRRRIEDNGLVALCLLVAHSKPDEKDVFVKLIVNLINKRNGGNNG
ncbi:virulence protein RhuM/Fic/DOC family protein [bacterium]|jgi:prophage maintenance system killer protein/prophage antirepressor-like protein|nr:virulence protein RhuM/Fic/DOC family protein [bacterium]